MDEPTSPLDAHAEHRVFAGLRRMARDRAVVLVTHRLANVDRRARSGSCRTTAGRRPRVV